jgi:putative transposase
MSRIARVVVPGLPHHVTQRGNGRQVTFLSDQDRYLYLDLLHRYRRQYGVSVWAYCLMSNHVHLLAVPERQDSLTRTLGRTHADYARYWNLRRNSCGHVWQARFYSCPLEDDQIWVVARYVEMNPVRAGLVEMAENWPWSSAQAHVAGQDASKRREMSAWEREYDGARWARVLSTTVDDEAWLRRLEEATVRGLPLRSESFVDDLERRMALRLRPNPPGRPPKPREESTPALLQMSLGIGN